MIDVQVNETTYATRYDHGDVVLRTLEKGEEKHRMLFSSSEWADLVTGMDAKPEADAEEVAATTEETTTTPVEGTETTSSTETPEAELPPAA